MMERKTQSVASTVSLRPKPMRKLTMDQSQDPNQAFLSKAIGTLRNGTTRTIYEHCQLEKFEKHRYTTEQKIKRWEEEDALHAAEERREFRESLLSNERNKKAETIRINHEITQKWKDTQMVKRDRVKADVQYEMAVQKIEHLKTIHRRQEAALEERKEIDLFEKNMKKMGIGGDADGIRLSVSYEAPELLEQRLKATLKAKEPSSEEIQSFVEQLKERTAEKRAARYEKARRRRRALTSTNNASTSAPDHVPS